MKNLHQLIIVGSGPAGLTAGIYAGRAGLNPIIIDGTQPGGQLTTTTSVENWPGETSIMGPALMMRMREHANACGVKFVPGMVTKTSLNGDCKTITLHNGEELSTQTLIVANGSSHKKLNIPGESEYFGRGVTVCATCDAPFYKDRRVVVVGGGNSAMTEAEHLTHFASHVTVLQIMPEISANDPVKDKVLNHPNVSVICNAQTTRIAGNEKGVTTVTYRDNTRGSEHDIEAGGVFVAIGLEPNTKPYHGQLELDAYGYIVLKNGSATSVPGVFAAGDIADPFYQQAITSAGDGCRAALDAQRYLTKISLTEI